MIREILSNGLRQLHANPSERQLSMLAAYMEEVERWNRRINLVRASGRELAVRHALDCLAGLEIISGGKHGSILDVGSGAGFPGVPLAVMLPESRVDLLERSSRKAQFLKNAAAVLGLPNVRILNLDIVDHKERYDAVCSRAFGKLSAVLDSMLKNLSPSGSLFLYKGKKTVVIRELAEVPWIKKRAECTISPVRVPYLDAERNILQITLHR